HEAKDGEYGPHTRARHLRPGEEGPGLDHELSHRGKPPILNSVFTVTEPAADKLIARTLDYNHEAVQRWLQEERDGLLDHKKGRGFNWPAGETIGRGWSPKEVFFDATSVRVFLKYDPSYPAGYRVQTAYPQF
ncbi:RNase A-like domain-containing protein, partial [Clavibacter michiganensis]|uniref:RNase A-like domain-containing protein n=1 Tax=Clavibacter michiganensis TaxID=28447 RepID=UPI00292CE131